MRDFKLPVSDIRALEAVSIAATAIAFAITTLLVTTGRAAEANPVTAEMLDAFGWTVAGVIAIAAGGATFEYLERTRNQSSADEWVPVAGAGVIATIALADAVYNIHLLMQVPDAGSFHAAKYGPPVLSVMAAGLLVFVRSELRCTFTSFTKHIGVFLSNSARYRHKTTVLALTILIATALVAPFVSVGPGPLVGAALAATSDNSDTFEDGNINGWSKTNGGTISAVSNSYHGSYSLQADPESNTDGIAATWTDGPSINTTKTPYMKGTVRADAGANTEAAEFGLQSGGDHVKVQINTYHNEFDLIYTTGGTENGTYGFGSITRGNAAWHAFNISVNSSHARVKLWDPANSEPAGWNATVRKNGDFSGGQAFAGTVGNAGLAELDRVAVNAENFSSAVSDQEVSGQVVTSDGGQPVSNATVKVLKANHTTLKDLEGSESAAREEAAEMLEEVNAEEPPEYQNFSADIKNNGGWKGSDGKLSNINKEYAAVHTQEDWSNRKAVFDPSHWPSFATASKLPPVTFDDPQLGQPSLRVPANEPVVITAWDATNTGLFDYQDSIDSDLPGETTKKNITVQKIGPGGTVLDSNFTLESREFAVTTNSVIAGKTHHAATTTLAPGVYRLVPEDGGMPVYVIAGEQGASEIASGYYDDLRTEANETSARADRINQLIEDKKMTTETVVTNETGHFSLSTGSAVKDVSIIAYKKPAALDDVTVEDLRDADTTRENISRSTIRTLYNESDYNGSVHIPTEADRYEVGNESQNVEVTVREVSAPDYLSIPRGNAAWAWFYDYLDSNTYAEAASAIQQRLEKLEDEDARELYQQMYKMAMENKQVREDNKDLMNATEAQDATISDLQNDTRQLEQAIQEMENSIEAGDGSSEIQNQTLSADQEFDTELDPANVQVLAHYANGTSETVPTDSEYVSIEDNLIGGSTIHLEDYPIGDAPAATAHFRVVTEDGMGESRQNARNPSFSGDIPELDAVDLTSLNPGPDETVRVRAHPQAMSGFGTVEDVTVHGPDGTNLNPSMTDSESAEFKTAGEGVHHVALTYSNLDGDNFTTTFRVMAADENRNMPASVRVKQSPVGTYALTGDKLSGGDASVSNGGATVNVAGRIGQEESAPGTVHVHTHGLSLAPDARTHVSVLRGDDGQTVSKNVRVVMHTPELSDEALVYRENSDALLFDKAAIGGDGSKYGSVEKRQQNATIRTYTNEDGRVTVQTIESPGWVERQTHRANGIAQSLPSPSLPFGMMAPGAPGAVATPQLSG